MMNVTYSTEYLTSFGMTDTSGALTPRRYSLTISSDLSATMNPRMSTSTAMNSCRMNSVTRSQNASVSSNCAMWIAVSTAIP